MRLLLDYARLPLVHQRRSTVAGGVPGRGDPANEVYLSVASVWEAVIKYAMGKLALPEAPAEYLPRQREDHRISSLPVDEAALVHLAGLPPLHRDPFCRILVAQALQHGLKLVTVDGAVRAYPIPLLTMV